MGLAGFIEVSLAAGPHLILSCVDLCGAVCRNFGDWVSNGNCTGGTFENTNYALSVNTGTATNIKISKDSVSPVSVFSVKYPSGVMCECVPANGQEFGTVSIPQKK